MNRLKQSIKTRIILITVAVICSGFIASEIHDYTLTKSDAVQEFEELLTIKADRLASSLELPLWEVDRNWVEKIIAGEMDDKRIYAVFVESDGELFVGKQRDKTWHIIDSANHISGDYLVRMRTISHQKEGIGSVKVYLTQQFMLEALRQRMSRELLSVALLALLVVIILVASLNRMVIRRLQNIMLSTRAIASGRAIALKS